MIPLRVQASRRAGLTIVETMIVVAILGIVLGGLTTTLVSTQRTFQTGEATMRLETEGSLVMARIVDALRAADLDSLSPTASPPFSSEMMNFQRSEGFDGSSTVWSAPQRVAFDPVDGNVVWTENPGLPDEQEIVWSRRVADYLEGELLSGTDTNGNGLIDERGLCFTREGDLVTVRLTLTGSDGRGGTIERTWTTRLYCRN